MTKYTPTTAHVRELWVDTQTGGEYGYLDNGERAGAAFDNWLAAEKAKWQAEGVKAAQDELVRRDAFTERSLRILDALIEKGSDDER